jgi:hypothetical protein
MLDAVYLAWGVAEGVILGSNILRADHRSQAQLGVPGRVGGFLVRSACWWAFGGFMFGIIADYIGRVTTRRDLIPAGLAATGLAASGAPVQARPAQKDLRAGARFLGWRMGLSASYRPVEGP